MAQPAGLWPAMCVLPVMLAACLSSNNLFEESPPHRLF
jgi:hypothetical protein